ncbi:MAG: SDR family oxidoreductase [Pseudonocardiaceae bacterium]|nr:SDR family oxidoreductase [Pseudonocardiaceae bacterium]
MNRVAVVTGAARGIGRGIALVLGEAGATVYVTDRESREHKHSALPGTVEDTAEVVDRRGGKGVPLVVDHTDDDAVADLFERVRAEHGGLDLLVGNAFDGNALPFRGGPFWDLPLEHWRNMMESGVRAHLVAARFAAPLLIARGAGLIVLTGYTAPDEEVIAGNLYYDLAMSATSRLVRSLAYDLRPHGVSALAISPGFTRTEAIRAEIDEFPPGTDSVEFPGRAVRALFDDPEVARHAGRTIPVAELADQYGFTDLPPDADP